MSDVVVPGDARGKASELVRQATERNVGQVTSAEIVSIVDALEHDIVAAADSARIDEARISKIETQTQALAEAVIAMAETAATLAPAVRAVKAEMSSLPDTPD